MKIKIITGLVIATIATTGALAYANSNTGSEITNKIRGEFHKMEGAESLQGKMMGQRKGIKGAGMQLTADEKAKVATMTADEKKTFYTAKITEAKAKKIARENVMDKLINGEILTDSEKAVLAEIKTERAAMKAKQADMKAKMDAIKPILEKKKAGTTLTADEQAQLDAFKATNKQFGKMGKM
ncbi:hypothetical protein M0P65_04085 [Candidatus Gracilibacteria bacterium]|nr:hypothetical protein [Candidatus Gracilibacteria bacterium]